MTVVVVTEIAVATVTTVAGLMNVTTATMRGAAIDAATRDTCLRTAWHQVAVRVVDGPAEVEGGIKATGNDTTATLATVDRSLHRERPLIDAVPAVACFCGPRVETRESGL